MEPYVALSSSELINLHKRIQDRLIALIHLSGKVGDLEAADALEVLAHNKKIDLIYKHEHPQYEIKSMLDEFTVRMMLDDPLMRNLTLSKDREVHYRACISVDFQEATVGVYEGIRAFQQKGKVLKHLVFVQEARKLMEANPLTLQPNNVIDMVASV